MDRQQHAGARGDPLVAVDLKNKKYGGFTNRWDVSERVLSFLGADQIIFTLFDFASFQDCKGEEMKEKMH